MSVEPPPSGRPTGPPPGPLSGAPGPHALPPSGPPTRPPRPPSPPPGAPPPGGTPEPRRPWWRSAPLLALLTAAVVAVAAVAVVLARTDGGGTTPAGRGEVFLQAAGGTGPYPFTDNTATATSAPPTSTAPATEESATDVVRAVDGGAAGLYGGTRNVAACDVEKQIALLRAEPARNRAFAFVVRVAPDQVPAYLRSLTPVRLRMDTRVTNHGYRDGDATGYQAVLQAGTAVLVDARGEPRVRCACGNPLTRPIAQKTAPRPTGDSWPSYRPSNVVVVVPSSAVIDVFVLHGGGDGWFARERGDTGREDRPAEAPENPPEPSGSVPPPASPSGTGTPCPPTPADAPGSVTCPPTSAAPSPPPQSPASPPPASPEPESSAPQPPAPPSPSAPPPGPSSEPGHEEPPQPAGSSPAL
ncbi:DUF6777 domain-containing protein [Streptomyces sp. NPDC088812]|uniref:DUF6777 domain-containing protein n=1 Tax=Streptomyces sp. NPDC088812 TaxID=3365905 RepID=UPI00381AC3A1